MQKVATANRPLGELAQGAGPSTLILGENHRSELGVASRDFGE